MRKTTTKLLKKHSTGNKGKYKFLKRIVKKMSVDDRERYLRTIREAYAE